MSVTQPIEIPSPCTAEELVGEQWAEWYAMGPEARWAASHQLWAQFVALGGSLEPEVDLQSPFWSEEDYAEFARRAGHCKDESCLSLRQERRS